MLAAALYSITLEHLNALEVSNGPGVISAALSSGTLHEGYLTIDLKQWEAIRGRFNIGTGKCQSCGK